MPVEKMNREVPLLAKILPTFSHFNRNSHLDFVHNEINIIKMCIWFTVINSVKIFNIYMYSKIILKTIHAMEKCKKYILQLILHTFPPTLHCKLNNISLTTVQFPLNIFMNRITCLPLRIMDSPNKS